MKSKEYLRVALSGVVLIIYGAFSFFFLFLLSDLLVHRPWVKVGILEAFFGALKMFKGALPDVGLIFLPALLLSVAIQVWMSFLAFPRVKISLTSWVSIWSSFYFSAFFLGILNASWKVSH